jgi:hypothetical protein
VRQARSCGPGFLRSAKYAWEIQLARSEPTPNHQHPDLCMEGHSAPGRCSSGKECCSRRNPAQRHKRDIHVAKASRNTLRMHIKAAPFLLDRGGCATANTTARSVQIQKPVNLMYIITITQSYHVLLICESGWSSPTSILVREKRRLFSSSFYLKAWSKGISRHS